jgi:hypothetical protein
MAMSDGLTVSWLDVKLGLRMLRKRPVMTGAALFALAVGIPASMVPGRVADAVTAPIPEDADHRIRSLRYWDQARSAPAAPTYFEVARWREGLTTFATVGAFRAGDYNLPSDGGRAAPVSGAEMTASAFETLGVVPLLGRALDRGDERPGGPDAVVVGHDLWQGRLGGDPGVIGTTLRVGGVPHTVVGVMPEGFLFPARQQLWLPLREELLVGPALGRELQVFGRLAAGVSAEEAHAEVTAFGSRLAAEFPATNARLAAEVVRFGTSELSLPRGGWAAMSDAILLRALALVLFTVACANVAMLLFAGTATRFRELAIRTSLGASRRRIIAQLFVEALVLALSAAGVGLLSISAVLARLRSDRRDGRGDPRRGRAQRVGRRGAASAEGDRLGRAGKHPQGRGRTFRHPFRWGHRRPDRRRRGDRGRGRGTGRGHRGPGEGHAARRRAGGHSRG